MQQLRLSISILSLLLCSSSLLAQTAHSFSELSGRDLTHLHSGESKAVDFIVLPDESAYLLLNFKGDSIRIGGSTYFNTGATSSLLLKYNPQAQVDWVISIEAGGSIFDNEARAMALDSSGNIVVAGNFRDTLFAGTNHQIVGPGNGDFYLLKINPSGSILWARSYGHSSSGDFINALACDANDAIYICGSFMSDSLHLNGLSLTKESRSDFYVAALTKDGYASWAQNPKASNGRSMALALDVSDEELAVGGFYEQGSLEIGNLSSPTPTMDDVWLAKLKKGNGNPIWLKSFGGSSNDWLSAITFGQEKDLYLAANFNSSLIYLNSDTITLSCNGGFFCNDFLVAKLDSLGNSTWARQSEAPYSSDAGVYDLNVDTDNNVYLSGFYGEAVSYGRFPLPDPGSGIRGLVAKLSADGVYLWAKASNGNQNEIFKSMQWLNDSSLFLAGEFRGSFLNLDMHNLSNPSTKYQFFRSKLDLCYQANQGFSMDSLPFAGADSITISADSNLVHRRWSNQDTGISISIDSSQYRSMDQISIIAHDDQGCLYRDTLYFEGSKGSLKIETPNSIALISLWPNPFKQYLEIEIEGKEEFSIYNLQGQLIYKGHSSLRLNTQAWSKGVYLLKRANGESLKIIKS